jgi:hypothetical protein
MAPERSPENLTTTIDALYLMNQKATYEATITSKLEQLPIPDMRDAIWSRIEGELDADMPTDDGGDTPPSSPNGGNLLRFVLPSVAVIIITFFLITTNNKPSQPVHTNNTPNNQPVINTAPTALPPPTNANTINSGRNAPVVYTGTTTPVPGSNSPIDSSAAVAPDIVPPVTDNTNQQALPIVQAPTPVKTDTVAGKKPRGVPGITDKDYRIVPVKDSTRKN